MSLENNDVEQIRQLILSKLTKGGESRIPVDYEITLNLANVDQEIKKIEQQVQLLSQGQIQEVYKTLQDINESAQNLSIMLNQQAKNGFAEAFSKFDGHITSKVKELNENIEGLTTKTIKPVLESFIKTEGNINNFTENASNQFAAFNNQLQEVENQLKSLSSTFNNELKTQLSQFKNSLKTDIKTTLDSLEQEIAEEAFNNDLKDTFIDSFHHAFREAIEELVSEQTIESIAGPVAASIIEEVRRLQLKEADLSYQSLMIPKQPTETDFEDGYTNKDTNQYDETITNKDHGNTNNGRKTAITTTPGTPNYQTSTPEAQEDSTWNHIVSFISSAKGILSVVLMLMFIGLAVWMVHTYLLKPDTETSQATNNTAVKQDHQLVVTEPEMLSKGSESKQPITQDMIDNLKDDAKAYCTEASSNNAINNNSNENVDNCNSILYSDEFLNHIKDNHLTLSQKAPIFMSSYFQFLNFDTKDDSKICSDKHVETEDVDVCFDQLQNYVLQNYRVEEENSEDQGNAT